MCYWAVEKLAEEIKILGAVKFNNTEWPFNDSLGREITVNNFIDSLETELVI